MKLIIPTIIGVISGALACYSEPGDIRFMLVMLAWVSLCIPIGLTAGKAIFDMSRDKDRS